MKKEDNITQLYKDAFSDFSVSAPQGVYKKVQLDLGRKSLLTLDPSRLNVFYLALMSGLVAWAILGNNSAETAEVNKTQIVNANTAAVIQHDPIQKDDVSSVIQSFEEVELTETVQPLLAEKVVRESPRSNFLSGMNSSQEVIDTPSVSEETNSNGEDLMVEEVVMAETPADNAETIIENTREEEVAKIDLREKISLNNARVESANELMRLLALDSDKKGALTISTKKK